MSVKKKRNGNDVTLYKESEEKCLVEGDDQMWKVIYAFNQWSQRELVHQFEGVLGFIDASPKPSDSNRKADQCPE